MFDWLKGKKPRPVASGPDFSSVDSDATAAEWARDGRLQPLWLLPPEFGGADTPQNRVWAPDWVVRQKADIDRNIVRPLVEAGRVTRYRASPRYQGASVVPTAIRIEASDPGSFSTSLAIWGDAVTSTGAPAPRAAGSFDPAVAALLTLAPPAWHSMRVVYRHDDVNGMAVVEPYVKASAGAEWVRVSCSDFALMDFFDELRAQASDASSTPWTTATLYVVRDAPEPTVEFGYEPQNLLPAS